MAGRECEEMAERFLSEWFALPADSPAEGALTALLSRVSSAAREGERERCAKVAEEFDCSRNGMVYDPDGEEISTGIAAALRAPVAGEPKPSPSDALGLLAEARGYLNAEYLASGGTALGARALIERIDALLSTKPSAGEEVQAVSALYQELLMAVARKWPNESRHETALRYIREAERQEATTAKSSKPAPSGGRGGA